MKKLSRIIRGGFFLDTLLSPVLLFTEIKLIIIKLKSYLIVYFSTSTNSVASPFLQTIGLAVHIYQSFLMITIDAFTVCNGWLPLIFFTVA